MSMRYSLSLSKGNFIPYIPLYSIFLSTIVFSIRDYTEIEQSAVSIGVIHKIIFMLITFWLIFMYFSLHKKLFIKLPSFLLFYMVYLILGLLSLSQARLLGYSAWKLFEVVTTFCLAIYIITTSHNQPKSALVWYEKILKMILFIVFLAVVGLFISPSRALHPPSSINEAFLNYQLVGYIINTNPNSLGMLSSILLIVSICRLFSRNRNTKYWTSVALISFVVMVLSQSRTAWVAFGIAILAFINFSSVRISSKMLLIFIIGLVWYFGKEMLILYFQRGASVGLIMKLSGRMEWWEYGWDIIKENIFTGLGFAEGSRRILLEYGAGTASTLHSDYLDSAASVGIFGLLLITCVFISSVLYLLRNRYVLCTAYSKSYWMELFFIVLMLWIRSFTGTVIASFNYFLIIFFVIMTTAYIGVRSVEHQRIHL